jgi:hypothetical protein
MLTITVQVPEKRDRAGFVAIADGFTTLIEDTAIATSGIGAAAGGTGMSREHPPFGRYELTARAPTPGGAETEYGNEILLFEPIAGPALTAESYGRFYVLVYAGSAGRDALLRRTQGGVRLARRAMDILLAHLRAELEVELIIVALTSPPWWAFWRRAKTPPSLSADPPRLTAPPYDEATIAAQMLRSAIRRERPARRSEERDDDRWRDRDSYSENSRESGSTGFRGGGGTGGGGGASGGWGDAPAAGRGPGVSPAGVIVGAAGAAAVAAVAAELASSASNETTRPGDTSQRSGSDDADSGFSTTTTSTAY